MSNYKLVLSAACAMAMVVMVGCNDKPPEDAARATVKPITKAPAATVETPAETPELAAVQAPADADIAPPAATPAPPTGESAPEPSAPPTPADPNVSAVPDPNAAPMVDGQAVPLADDAAKAPVTPEGVAATSGAATPAGGKTFHITPNDDSSIGFIGYKKIGGKREGYFANFDGTVTQPTGAVEGSQVAITIDLNQMSTTAKALTDTLQGEEYFNTAVFPKATFTSSNIAKGEGDKIYNVTGAFDFHGIANEITFPVEIEMQGDKLHVKTVGDGFVVNRHDWGISATGVTAHGATDDIILDDVLITFDVLAEPTK